MVDIDTKYLKMVEDDQRQSLTKYPLLPGLHNHRIARSTEKIDLEGSSSETVLALSPLPSLVH
jgi:hypothetical protein